MKMNRNVTYFPSTSEDVAFDATDTTFTPPADIYVMRVLSDQNCVITWLNAGSVEVVAGLPEHFQVHPGDDLSVTRKTADGTLSVSWMTN